MRGGECQRDVESGWTVKLVLKDGRLVLERRWACAFQEKVAGLGLSGWKRVQRVEGQGLLEQFLIPYARIGRGVDCCGDGRWCSRRRCLRQSAGQTARDSELPSGNFIRHSQRWRNPLEVPKLWLSSGNEGLESEPEVRLLWGRLCGSQARLRHDVKELYRPTSVP